MSDETVALRGMLEKGTHADLLREMIGVAVERLLSGPAAPGCCAAGPDGAVRRGSWRSRA